MNERILELARQVWPDPNISHVNHMKFAELIVQECAKYMDNWEEYQSDMMNHTNGNIPTGGGVHLKQYFGVEECLTSPQ